VSTRELDATARAFTCVVQHQRLPAEHLGKRGLGVGRRLCGRRVVARLRPALAAVLALLVLPQLGLDIAVDVTSRTPRAATPPPTTRSPRLVAQPLPGRFGLLDEILEEIADVVRDVLDHREDLLEYVAHEVRCRDPEILGEAPDVIGELLRDAGVEHPLLAPVVPAAMAMPVALAPLGASTPIVTPVLTPALTLAFTAALALASALVGSLLAARLAGLSGPIVGCAALLEVAIVMCVHGSQRDTS